MALNARENINGVTPQDLNKMNTNFMSIWKTLFGGLDFSDTNNELKKKIQTQQMPVQGESNFDMNFPAYIRFFVPTNTKEITSTSFNIICERYRMDSGVAMDGGSIIDAPIEMSLASASTGIASVSSPTVGVSSVGGGGSTSASNSELSTYVNYWGNWNPKEPDDPSYDVIATVAPYKFYSDTNETGNNAGDFPISGYPPYGTAESDLANYPHYFAAVYEDDRARHWLDLATVQHKHIIPSHKHTLPDHSHNVSLEPHTHTIELEPHTHEASAKISIPDHSHKLKEGIQISQSDALGVNVKLNGNVIATLDSASNSIKNNVDAKDFVKIGEWNTIECTTQNLARITIYGIIELVMNY